MDERTTDEARADAAQADAAQMDAQLLAGAEELRLAVARLGRRIRAQRAGDDISDSQMHVLFLLEVHGATTLTRLAALDGITPPSMNRTVGTLVEAGLVRRTVSADDARKAPLELTDAGRAATVATRARRGAWFADRYASLTDAERAVVDAAAPVLRTLADA